jgi:hypothetical protein
MQETEERFHELTSISFMADKVKLVTYLKIWNKEVIRQNGFFPALRLILASKALSQTLDAEPYLQISN